MPLFRLFHVADAGNLGGGMLSNFAASLSFSAALPFFEELRMRLRLNRRSLDSVTGGSPSTKPGFSSIFGVCSVKLGALGPLGFE